jgi:hypothetical protein
MLDVITLDTIAVCEGKEDRALVDRLIDEGLVRPMHTLAIGDFGAGPGIDGLRSELEGLAVVTGFSLIRRMAIIADNDLLAPPAFDRIVAALNAANANPDVGGVLSVPAAPYHRGVGALIETVALLCPGPGLSGCLEDVLMNVLRRMHGPKIQCVDNFISCAQSTSPPSIWTPTKEQKARVRGSMTVLQTDKPNLPLHGLWRDNPNLIPASSPEFGFLSFVLNAL